MPLPKLNPPPQQWLDQNGRLTRQAAEWIDVMYRKLGSASDEAPIKSQNITGELASLNLNPGSRQNAVNRATVDSIDAGGSTTIRIYGPGGVGTEWPQEVNGAIEHYFPSGTLPGFGYGVKRDIYYSESGRTFLAFDPATEFASSLRDEYRWVGRVTTIAVGGADATATATISSGSVVAISVTNQGTGYISAPAVSISGGGGTGATAVANISGGKVVSVSITNVGSGYTSAPSVAFSGGRSGTTGGGGSSGGSGGVTAWKYMDVD